MPTELRSHAQPKNFDAIDLVRDAVRSIDPASYSPITEEASNKIWSALQDSPLEHRYIMGNCHDRAHFVSLVVKEVTEQECFKIWNFAPNKFPDGDGSLLSVADPNHLTASGTVTFGYHVAAAVQTAAGIRVIDPALQKDGPISVDAWLERQGNPRSRYTYTAAKYYSFSTNNSRHLTGFFEYSGSSRLYHWMPYNLAILDVAMKIIHDETSNHGDIRPAIRTFLANIHTIEQVFRDGRMGNGSSIPDESFSFFIQDEDDAKQENRRSFLHHYQDYYDQRRMYWSDACAKLLP